MLFLRTYLFALIPFVGVVVNSLTALGAGSKIPSACLELTLLVQGT